MFERDWQRCCSKEKFTTMLIREHKGNNIINKDEHQMLREVHDVLLEVGAPTHECLQVVVAHVCYVCITWVCKLRGCVNYINPCL